jgi:hypothetical protein
LAGAVVCAVLPAAAAAVAAVVSVGILWRHRISLPDGEDLPCKSTRKSIFKNMLI